MTFSAQNLIPNPSFEDTVICPTYINRYSLPWFSPTWNTPDYFRSSCTAFPPMYYVPVNWMGTQNPNSGEAYAGCIANYNYVTYNGRDYISVKMKDSLIINHRYCVEFFVSLSDSSKVAVNFMGAHFSQTLDTMYCYPCPAFGYLWNLPFQPQIEDSTIISDTINWVKIKGSFIASGGEQYMTIGVFRPDSLLSYDTISGDGSNNQSYYYIDDVAVWDCDSIISITDYPEITLTPNPSNGEFILKGNFPVGTKLEIFDLLGQLVSDIEIPQGNQSFPISLLLAEGVYVFQVKDGNTILKSQKIVIVH